MKFTRTKIICTIGPATESLTALRKLHNNGMNVARINMSHATHKSAQLIIDRINKINKESKLNSGKIGILLDTQGLLARPRERSQRLHQSYGPGRPILPAALSSRLRDRPRRAHRPGRRYGHHRRDLWRRRRSDSGR